MSWPFRELKYGRTQALVARLRAHKIVQAWAGSFEALFHKQIDAVNRRLAEESAARGGGVLVPVGSVNPIWPGWEEDMRRCQELYRMPGIRLYPGYHGYGLDHPAFERLLEVASRRGLFVQIVIRMEDERVHHTAVLAPAVNTAFLANVLRRLPDVRTQLLCADTVFRSGHLPALVERTQVSFEISTLEGNGGILRMVEGGHPNYRGRVPIDRLLFGSHAPLFPCESAVLKLFESPLDRPQLDNLMHANARQFSKT